MARKNKHKTKNGVNEICKYMILNYGYIIYIIIVEFTFFYDNSWAYHHIVINIYIDF